MLTAVAFAGGDARGGVGVLITGVVSDGFVVGRAFLSFLRDDALVCFRPTALYTHGLPSRDHDGRPVGCSCWLLLIGKNIGKQVHGGWRMEHLKALGSVEWVNLDPCSK